MSPQRAVAIFLVVAGVGAPTLSGRAVAAPGDAEAGRALFTTKQCARCHRPAGEPGLGPALNELRRPQGEMELAGRLWNHLPAMAQSLAQDEFEWPRIHAGEMADLMAYLLGDAKRDPVPDLFKGQVALLRKGCLKCHSLRREGGPVKPDLADKRADYESAAAWAAAMWMHTPRMAAMARQQGLPYPRFVDDEMANLIGLLRSASGTPPR